jgi:hypothetical protein
MVVHEPHGVPVLPLEHVWPGQGPGLSWEYEGMGETLNLDIFVFI